MATYVERRIRRVADDALPASANPWRQTEALRWETFLSGDVDAVVLVAPSGSGKTTEFINLACRLRLGGHCAVRCEAVALSTTETLSHALEQLEAEAFGLWRDTDQTLVLLIDAVDELQLRGADFRRILRVIARSADLASRSVKLVFSARNGAWPSERTGHVVSLFRPFRSRDPAVSLVTFAALDAAQVGELAEAYGATRCREFVGQLEDDDVDSLMDLRPIDVELLVRQWNSTGRLGRWVDVLAGFLESVGAEAGPDRVRPPTLSPQQVRSALLRIGAATTLMKTPHVSLPESPPVGNLVSSRRLFDDWGLAALVELFEGGMFSPRGTDAVQLPQGAVTHYLTARWLVERVHAGMPIAALSELLFVQVPGTRNLSLPQSRRPIAGWIATLLPEFRATLSRHSPRDFLYEGDPECLTIQDIRPALSELMSSIASEERFDWPTQATRRKLARRELANDVLLMLQRHVGSPSALLQLLEFAVAGRYGEAVPQALTWALGNTQHPQVRAESVRLVRVLGSEAQVAQLVAITGEVDEDIRRELLQALAPVPLSGATLLAFLRGGRPGVFDLGVAFASLAKRLSVSQIDELLEMVVPVIDTETISSDVTRAADIAWILVAARLGSPGDSPVLTNALLAIERLQIHGVSLNPAVEDAEVERAIGGNRERRRALWDARVAQQAGRSDWLHLSSPRFGDLEREDFDWAVAAAEANDGNPAITERRRFVLNRLLSMLQDADLETIRTTAQGSLAERVDQVLEGRATARRQRDDRENERVAEHEQNRAALLPHRDGIRAGTDLNALSWAYGQLRGDGTHRRLDLQGLREEIGEDLARDVRAGFIAAWRRQPVELPTPGDNSVPYAVLVGLAGVSLEFQDGLDAASMSAGEVVLATRLAIRELNDFPSWAEDLLAAHRAVFRRELAAVLALEWKATIEHHGVLARAAYCSAPIAAEMRAIVMELMAEGPPGSARAARYGVDALLTSTTVGEQVARLVTRALNQAGQADPASVEWLRALAHFDPRACIASLAALPAELIVTVAARVYDDVNERRRAVRQTALLAPENIEAWARLLLDVVPPETDVRHAGVYTPNDRDHAQDFRMLCITRLSRDPTPAAGSALARLARTPQNRARTRRSWFRRLRSEQEAVAAEALAQPWSEAQVLAVERGDERAPRTLPELHSLVLRHLEHVRRLVENDDFSYRRLFSKKTQEREIQYWVASCLRERSRRLYSVVRENVVDNDKEVDITAIADGVGQVPIEIKPLGRYSAVALEETLDDQLLGRYMQPAERGFGVLLVVRRSQKSWTIGKRRVDLDGLCRHLQQRADALGRRHGKVLTVAAIDLLQGGAGRS